MAKLDPHAYPMPDLDHFDGDWRAADAAQMAVFDRLVATSNALPPDELVGALLSWQRGDGCAYYLVTKERPLTLQWVPFMDNWQVENALIRGITKADVLDQIERDRKFRAFFAKEVNRLR